MKVTSDSYLRHESPIRRWVVGHLGYIGHELFVAEMAGRLFDLTQEDHGLALPDRGLLRSAALVHDVGRVFGSHGHAKRGARMVLESEAVFPDFSERRMLAFLTRFHRGRVPNYDDRRWAKTSSRVWRLRVLLALLRAADALHNRSATIEFVRLSLVGNIIRVRGISDQEQTELIMRKGKKFRMMTEVFGYRMRVEDCRRSSVAGH